MSFPNKKMERTTKVRIALVSAILLIDIFLLPWMLMLPQFIVKNITTAPAEWLQYGMLRSIKNIFIDHRYLKLFLFMQLPVATLILYFVWDVERFKKRNRVADGVGGPEPAGDGQFGTSRWQTTQEMDKTATVWHTDEPIKKGGIVIGMDNSKKDREKIWFNNDDIHSLIIGATRSGKDRKILLPSIWELAKSGESMVIGDPKGGATRS